MSRSRDLRCIRHDGAIVLMSYVPKTMKDAFKQWNAGLRSVPWREVSANRYPVTVAPVDFMHRHSFFYQQLCSVSASCNRLGTARNYSDLCKSGHTLSILKILDRQCRIPWLHGFVSIITSCAFSAP